MQRHAQYFCYVYDAPERTPIMFALDADSLAEAVTETRRMMADGGGAGFAEIWDSGRDSIVRRIKAAAEGAPGPEGEGRLRWLRRGRPSSGSSKP
ncbi:hypothetical protein [Brevundimonas faecalis]|uniref:Uncharacterized protein n=1 Tax=Brevundimonas faecalis TaxID=947378 RepID=A0ABV2RDG9_9CAUL